MRIFGSFLVFRMTSRRPVTRSYKRRVEKISSYSPEDLHKQIDSLNYVKTVTFGNNVDNGGLQKHWTQYTKERVSVNFTGNRVSSTSLK